MCLFISHHACCSGQTHTIRRVSNNIWTSIHSTGKTLKRRVISPSHCSIIYSILYIYTEVGSIINAEFIRANLAYTYMYTSMLSLYDKCLFTTHAIRVHNKVDMDKVCSR